MKKLTLILILICGVCLTACSKDAQTNAFMKEYSAVTAQVAEKLEEGKVDEAQDIFDAKKDSLKAKWDAARTGLPFQYSAETKKKMKTDPEKNIESVVEAANKAIKKNPKSEAKVQALVLELANVFRQ